MGIRVSNVSFYARGQGRPPPAGAVPIKTANTVEWIGRFYLPEVRRVMIEYGFLRVAAATPLVRVADCAFNAEHLLALMGRAEGEGVSVLIFPELSLTGYTCADLFQQPVLQRGALEALGQVV